MKRTLNAATSSTTPSAFTRIASRNNLQSTTPTAYAPNFRTTTTPRQEALIELHWTDDNAVLSEDGMNDEENMSASEPEVRVLPSSQARYAEAKPSWWNKEHQQTLVEDKQFNMPFDSDLSYEEVFAWIATSPVGIETLDLEEHVLNYQNVKNLAGALEKNSTLTTLNLHGCEIGDESGIVLAEMLSKNKHLKSIVLSYNHFHSKGLTAIFNALTTNTSLTFLDVIHNHFDIKSAVALAQLIKTNKILKNLVIGLGNIPYAGIKALFDAAKLNTTLFEININSEFDNAKFLIREIKNEINKNQPLGVTKLGANFTLEIINSVLGRRQNPGAKPEEYDLMYPREVMDLITDQMMQAALKDALITMSAMSGDGNY